MHLSVDATGVTHLRQQMGTIPREIRDKAGRSVRVRAHEIESLAKQQVAVDTGYLKSTIGVNSAFDLRTSTSDLVATVGASAHYAAYVEYGTAKMPPRPFLGPAFDTVRPRFEADIEAIMREAFT
ncbi:HK97-gp10 family putative phage morphogenesis protein [Tessaracoccus palaemonis]|uniref:HK97 gp10 family phage protein n=1 Tax=Tessaracoccus palaemonis TaxID=2829499 RepID=A0ABX8SHL1_9ACTN|nr:HK97-gp10 family putative phage morphogenesis protein [Tessaracoccus palaemonis]QXT62753.1 HK97 gp10 family phage protein [Tessaracoccus palaemonis]